MGQKCPHPHLEANKFRVNHYILPSSKLILDPSHTRYKPILRPPPSSCQFYHLRNSFLVVCPFYLGNKWYFPNVESSSDQRVKYKLYRIHRFVFKCMILTRFGLIDPQDISIVWGGGVQGGVNLVSKVQKLYMTSGSIIHFFKAIIRAIQNMAK